MAERVPEEPRPTSRFEPWPWMLGLALAGMIGVCLAFWWTAHVHADVEITDERPGLLAPGADPRAGAGG